MAHSGSLEGLSKNLQSILGLALALRVVFAVIAVCVNSMALITQFPGPLFPKTISGQIFRNRGFIH